MPTTVATGSPQALSLQSVGIFSANMQRLTTLNRLAGKMPKEPDEKGGVRFQSSPKMPIVRCMDLAKGAGDEVKFDFVQPINMYPIMGDATAEGRGAAITFEDDSLKLNQSRVPISAGGRMSQQRTIHKLRNIARGQAQAIMDRVGDQRTLVHLAGARGFHNSMEWSIPLASHARFAEIMVNTVRAPSKNRHYMSTGSGIEAVSASGGDLAIATTDVMNMDVVDALRATLDSMQLAPPPVEFDGDKLSADSPIRVLMVSAEQYLSFVQSGNFRVLQSNAMARSAQAGNNPLFAGDAGLWNGILVVKMPKPIRFYAGDAYKYCATITSATESSLVIPSSFSTTHAVDRAILLGGQAIAEAWGTSDSGAPFFWSEEKLDHGNQTEICIGSIGGQSKIRFTVDYGDSGMQPTDHGVICIDTAVRIAA
jgi:N4-gp56 family major capsid protein